MPIMLIAMCASHIDGPDRLRALHHMLESVSKQTQPIDLFLSISGPSKHDIDALKQEFGGWLHVAWRGSERLAQFQHYCLLCDEITHDPDNCWCMFTDDDDEWHERRVEHYATAVRVIPEVDAMVCVGGRVMNDRPFFEPIEYFEFASKLGAFQRFCHDVHPDTLALRGCDLVWRNAMIRTMSCGAFRCAEGVPYLYRQVTPMERMLELESYIGSARDAWNAYVKNMEVKDTGNYVTAVLLSTPLILEE